MRLPCDQAHPRIHTAKGDRLIAVQRYGIPTYHGDYCLTIDKSDSRSTQVTINQFNNSNLRPVVRLDTFSLVKSIPRDYSLILENRYHFYPDWRLLVSIPPSNDVLLIDELPAWK
jgi:hypothetical protein